MRSVHRPHHNRIEMLIERGRNGAGQASHKEWPMNGWEVISRSYKIVIDFEPYCDCFGVKIIYAGVTKIVKANRGDLELFNK